MFLNAVVLVLQEVIEAALLMSILLVVAQLINRAWEVSFLRRSRWALYSIAAGNVGAILYALSLPAVSQWFDYMGIEVINALSEVVIFVLLMLFAFLLPADDSAQVERRHFELASRCMIVMVALAITREGSEIYLYMNGVAGQEGQVGAVMLGGLTGAGIGISAGVLLYYGLISIPYVWAVRISLVLLAVVAGNMLSQAVLLLTQADWLPYTSSAWDTSTLIPEGSLTGRLLYALVGYESQPSLLQVSVYVIGTVIIFLTPMVRSLWRARPGESIA